MKKLLSFLLFSLLFAGGMAQVSDTLEVSAPIEEAAVNPPNEDSEETAPEPLFLPKDSIEKLRRQPDYQYMKNLDSMLRNLQMQAPEPEQESAPSKSIFDLAFVKMIVWGLAIFAVLYILYQLLAGQQNLFYKNKRLETAEETDQTNQQGISPLLLSQQAAARGDFRMAVRYQYLYILQLMGEKRIILLQPQKSDAQYQHEVRGKPLAADFSLLTLQYEYVWFGEFALNKEQYQLIAGGYRKFIETWL